MSSYFSYLNYNCVMRMNVMVLCVATWVRLYVLMLFWTILSEYACFVGYTYSSSTYGFLLGSWRFTSCNLSDPISDVCDNLEASSLKQCPGSPVSRKRGAMPCNVLPLAYII